MDKLKVAWQKVVDAHTWVIDKIQDYPAATFWCGLAIVVVLVVWR